MDSNDDIYPTDDIQVEHIDNIHTSDCFFSDYVSHLLSKVFSTKINTDSSPRFDGILNPDLTFNLHQLDHALHNLLSTKDVSYEPESTEEMSAYLDQVVPVINCVYGRFDEIRQSDNTGQLLSAALEPNLFWMGHWKRYLIDSIDIALNTQLKLFGTALDDAAQEAQVRHILALSIITSGIEQTLGNLVLTQSHFVPPLLKNLLAMPELESLIDIRLIRLLKVVVGPPITINLRNILWHGFVNCSQQIVDPATNATADFDLLAFVYFLLAIIASISAELQKKSALTILKIDSSEDEPCRVKSQIVSRIPQRRLWDFESFATKLEPIFPIVNFEFTQNCDYFRNLIVTSPLIHRTLRPLWLSALQLLFEGSRDYRNYAFCLLLPLLESTLRYLYCSANRLPNRLLTAISKEYYVTFTEILAYRSLGGGDAPGDVPTGPLNRLYALFPRPLMLLLCDVILLPEGLRFRDRLSHGQIAFHSLNGTITNFILSALMALFELSNGKLLPVIPRVFLPPAFQEITRVVSVTYECQYHPVYQLRGALKCLAHLWLQFVRLCAESQVEVNECVHYRAILQSHLVAIESVHLNIFEEYIAKSEQLVLLLRNCTSNYQTFAGNLGAFLTSRREELAQCKLRSRQRVNYQRLLHQSGPLYLKAFCADGSAFWRTMLYLLEHLGSVTQRWTDTATEKNSLEKKLKRLLKCAQNMAQQSGLTENRWDCVDKLCAQQEECLTALYSQMIEVGM